MNFEKLNPPGGLQPRAAGRLELDAVVPAGLVHQDAAAHRRRLQRPVSLQSLSEKPNFMGPSIKIMCWRAHERCLLYRPTEPDLLSLLAERRPFCPSHSNRSSSSCPRLASRCRLSVFQNDLQTKDALIRAGGDAGLLDLKSGTCTYNNTSLCYYSLLFLSAQCAGPSFRRVVSI